MVSLVVLQPRHSNSKHLVDVLHAVSGSIARSALPGEFRFTDMLWKWCCSNMEMTQVMKIDIEKFDWTISVLKSKLGDLKIRCFFMFLMFLSRQGASWRESEGNHQNFLSLSLSCLFFLLDMYQTWNKPFFGSSNEVMQHLGEHPIGHQAAKTISFCLGFRTSNRCTGCGEKRLGPQPFPIWIICNPVNPICSNGTDEKEIPKVPSGV